VGADLAHNLGDGERSEILLKEKCLDDVVLSHPEISNFRM
jgi:hypothetical protein